MSTRYLTSLLNYAALVILEQWLATTIEPEKKLP